MSKRNILYISFILVFFLIPIYLGFSHFNDLQEEKQETNLRFLSSALIQAYATILAVVPTISLALKTFFVSKYPYRLTTDNWKYLEWPFFIVLMFSSIGICYFVLTSISDVPKGIVVPFLGTPLIIDSLNELLFLNIISIGFVFAALIFLFVTVAELTDVEIIFENLKEEILRYNEEIRISENFNRNETTEKDQLFEDYFFLINSLAESKNLTGLRVGIKILFELIIEDERHYDKVNKMLGEISKKFRENKEKFCFESVEKMISNGYMKIVESDNTALKEICSKK